MSNLATRDETSTAFLKALIAAQPAGEDAIQSMISDRLNAAGCTVETVEYDPAEIDVVGEFASQSAQNPEPRSAVVGTLPGDPGLPSLLMFAHPDGEPVAGTERWTRAPFAGEVAGDRLYGWGVADDLAGCAAAVMAIERAAATGQRLGPVIFASTPSKRHARGVHALLHKGIRADASLYLHPAESGVGMREIKAVASGQLEFRITVTGQFPPTTEPGQTSFSHLGVNPIDKALVIRAALYALAEDRASRIRHPLIEAEVGRATNLHISRIVAGAMRKYSRLTETCEMGGAIAFPPGETLEQVQAEVEGAIAVACAGDDWLGAHPPRIDWLAGVTGAEVPAGHPLFQTAAAAVLAVTGAAPHVNPMHTSSDIRNPMVQAGIPCIGLGCLGGDLSQNGLQDEWVDLPDYLRMVEVTTRTVTGWCGAPHDAPA